MFPAYAYPRMRSSSAGFSLVELLVSMFIGLLLIAGVGATFLGSQQTHQTKQHLDNAMEAYRFGAYAISRHIRQAESVDSVGEDAQGNPFIRLDMIHRGVNVVNASYDCNGNLVPADPGSLIVELKLNKSTSELLCTTLPANGVEPGVSQAILQPISLLYFTCKTSNTNGQLIAAPDCFTATAVSVRLGVHNSTSNIDNVQTFLVSMRMRALRLPNT